MATGDESMENDTIDLSKKKKSKKRANKDATVLTNIISAVNVSAENADTEDGSAVNDEYSYDYMVSRIYEKLPSSQSSATDIYQTSVPLPQLGRIGTRRVAVTNFPTICRALKRNEKELQAYFSVELGARSSVDAHHELILWGRFNRVHIESVLRSFVRDYVTCKQCHHSDTKLEREDRLTMLVCHKCLSKYCVPTIRTG